MKILPIALLLTVASCRGAPAMAQPNENCGPHSIVVERLETRYGETIQSIGIDYNGLLVELFASHETGSWSITTTAPGGVTCIVSSGQSYFRVSDEAQPNL